MRAFSSRNSEELSAFEDRRALLEKRVERFAKVGSTRIACKRFRLAIELLAQRCLQTGVDQPLGGGEPQRRHRCQLARELQGLFRKRFMRHHPVYQTDTL